MPLQTSGQISLNDLHVEAGGTTGTECSFNDEDIRGLIGKGSAAQSGLNEFYGASSVDRTSRSLAINRSEASGYNMNDYYYTFSRGANNSSSNTKPTVRMHTSANGLFSLITHYCFHPAVNYNAQTSANDLDHNTRAGIGLIVSQHNSDTSTGTVTSTTSKLLQPSDTGTTSDAWRANGFPQQVAAITNEGDVYVAFYTVEGFSSSQTNEESWHVIKLDKDLSIQWAKKWEWSSGVGLDGANNTGSLDTWGDNPTTTVWGIGKQAEGAFIFDNDNWFLGVQDICRLENSSGENASTEARNFIIKGSKSTGARQASVARYISASNMPGSSSATNGSFTYKGFYGNTQFKLSLSPNSSSTFYMYSGPALRMDTMQLSDLSSTGYQHTKFKTFNDGTYDSSNIRRAFVALDGRFVVQHHSSVTEGKNTTYTEHISIYSTSGNLDTFKILDSTDSSRFVDILGPWGDGSSTDGFAVLQFYSAFGNTHQTDMFDRLTSTKLGIPYIAYDNTASTLTSSNHLSNHTQDFLNTNDPLEIHPEDHEMYTIGVAPKFANEQSSSPQYPTWSGLRYRSMLSVKRSDIVYNTTRQSFAIIKPAVASADTGNTTGTPTYPTPTATWTDRTSSVGALSSWTPDVDGANVSSLWTTNTWQNNKFSPVGTVYSKRFSA